MKTLGKTKIARVIGGEIYFKRVQFDNGDLRWQPMERDTSALLRSDQESKFTGSSCVQTVPTIHRELRAPLPDDFADDLIGAYSANKYCAGHEPAPTLRF
jgi:hypothetical protein